MTRHIAATTGTSIAAGVPRYKDNPEAYAQAIRERCRKEAQTNPQWGRRVSAEYNGLSRLGLKPDTRVTLLCTETPDGLICAQEVKRILEEGLRVSVDIEQIPGLQVTDAQRFRREGVQNLFKALDKLSASSPMLELHISGGFKAVVPYVAIYGHIRQYEVSAIFELSEDLLRLPPLPLAINGARLHQARDALLWLEAESVATADEFFEKIPGLPYHERESFHAFLETDDSGDVTPSAFALLFLSEMTAQSRELRLSPEVDQALRSAKSGPRELMLRRLNELADPMLRNSQKHFHHIPGSDLSFYKPGRTKERLAWFQSEGLVHVAKVWWDHSDYERECSRLQRSQFNPKSFIPHFTQPLVVEQAPNSLSASPADARLDQLSAELESERDRRKQSESERETQHGLTQKAQAELSQERREKVELERSIESLQALQAETTTAAEHQIGELTQKTDELRRQLQAAERRREAAEQRAESLAAQVLILQQRIAEGRVDSEPRSSVPIPR